MEKSQPRVSRHANRMWTIEIINGMYLEICEIGNSHNPMVCIEELCGGETTFLCVTDRGYGKAQIRKNAYFDVVDHLQTA